MFSSRFFRKLAASYAAIVLITSGLIGLLVHEQMKRSLLDGLVADMEAKNLLLGPYARSAFAAEDVTPIVREVNDIGGSADLRITLIRPDGVVLADSRQDPTTMDNHLSRPEVQASLRAPFGSSRRYSQTVKYSMMYVATALRAEEKLLGIVRVSIPLREIDGMLSAMRGRVTAGAVLGMVVALGVGLVVARRITAPISEMTQVAESLRDRKYDRRVKHLPGDEIGILGDTMNRLAEEVSRQFAELSREQAQIQAMICGMVEGVFAVDPNEVVLFSNEAADRFLGVGSLADRSKPVWEQVRVAGLMELLADARGQEEPASHEIIVRRNGRETVLYAHAAQFEGGDGQGVVVVLHDVTDLRQLERMRRDFVANVSHELKTPLTAIKGYVETLIDGGLQDEEVSMRFLRNAERNVTRLTSLVTDLLSLARIESEEGGPPLVPVNWSSVVNEVVRRSEALAAEKSIAIELELPDDGVSVTGDPESMTQILENLLDNAIKYTPDSGVVRVRTERIGARGILEVEDTGIGIPERDRDRIFERFYRVDKARSRELGGTGLGLSIVKHLSNLMKGEVTLSSEEGEGSCFAVSLPLAEEGEG